MKKIAEKVALIALTCITFVFALISVLYAADVIPHRDAADNGVAIILLSVLGAIYVGLAVYLIYVNFSEKINVKRIMLFYDAESATRANSKVIDNIVNGCAKQIEKIKVRKTKIRVDDKLGLIATVHVEAAAEDITDVISQLRNLLVTSFKDTLGLKFNAINFEIDKLSKKFVPKANRAEETNEEPATAEVATTNEDVAVAAEPVTIEPTEVETVRFEDLVDA